MRFDISCLSPSLCAFAPLRLCVEISLLVLLTLTLFARTASAQTPLPDTEVPAYETDEASGRRYRVTFDPASRITLGIAGAATRGRNGKLAPAAEIDAGIAYRTVRAKGEGKERVTWQIEHRVVSGWVQPWAGPRASLPAFDAGLYGIALMRHDESPSVVLPTSPPVGIPFPFDVGLDADAGRVSIASLATGRPVIHVGVLRAALLLDPWRSRARGRILAIGVGARYDVDVEASAAPRVVHRVAPMTAGSIRFRVESADGRTALDARGEVAPCWSTDRTWGALARASLHVERTLVAVADQPITAFLDGGYRLDPVSTGSPVSDFRASLGLALHLSMQ